MAISSGRGKKLRTMSKPAEYFAVGEEFLYSPVSHGGIDVSPILLQVIERSNHYNNCNFCRIYEWCGTYANQMQNENGEWKFFVPLCLRSQRDDNKDVYFKEI